jgi:hypothetical protein
MERSLSFKAKPPTSRPGVGSAESVRPGPRAGGAQRALPVFHPPPPTEDARRLHGGGQRTSGLPGCQGCAAAAARVDRIVNLARGRPVLRLPRGIPAGSSRTLRRGATVDVEHATGVLADASFLPTASGSSRRCTRRSGCRRTRGTSRRDARDRRARGEARRRDARPAGRAARRGAAARARIRRRRRLPDGPRQRARARPLGALRRRARLRFRRRRDRAGPALAPGAPGDLRRRRAPRRRRAVRHRRRESRRLALAEDPQRPLPLARGSRASTSRCRRGLRGEIPHLLEFDPPFSRLLP